MTRSEKTRLWNHLMRLDDKEFEAIFAQARNQRIINKYYEAVIVRELKRDFTLTKVLGARN